MIPPGLAYCAVSERSWKRMDETTSPRYYFDLPQGTKIGGERRIVLHTGDLAVRGAGSRAGVLSGDGQRRLSQGREVLVDNAELCARDDRAGAQALGLKLYAASPAAALTAICSPDGIDSGKIVKEFRRVVRCGGRQWPKRDERPALRIAHIGYYDYLDTIGILGALEHVLARVTGKTAAYGAALRAAQEVYARGLSSHPQIGGA